MTEPDEAQKWAIDQKAPLYLRHYLALAYRAGQAASAARIKALEEALLNLVDRVTEDDGEGCQTGVNAAEMISARVVLLKEADQ